jgi:hypothetical protein
VDELPDRISSFGGDRGDSMIEPAEPEMILGAGMSSGLLSYSSGIVSLDKGRAALPELWVEAEVGDFRLDDVVGLDVLVADVRGLDGLIGVIREEVVVVGRFGGADAALPNVVRLDLSAFASVLAVRETLVPRVEVLAGRLFSSPSAAAPSSPLFPAGFLVEEVVGLVGGLFIVLPAVREDSALVRDVVDEATFLDAVPSLDEVVSVFLESSVEGLAGGFAPVVVRLSIWYAIAARHRDVADCSMPLDGHYGQSLSPRDSTVQTRG